MHCVNVVQIAQNFDQSDVTAVIFRVHHVLADGLALVTFMDAITKPMPGDDEKTYAPLLSATPSNQSGPIVWPMVC